MLSPRRSAMRAWARPSAPLRTRWTASTAAERTRTLRYLVIRPRWTLVSIDEAAAALRMIHNDGGCTNGFTGATDKIACGHVTTVTRGLLVRRQGLEPRTRGLR